MKKFAVILSGCGVYDGSEIHEAIVALLAITKAGAAYQAFAPDVEQHHVINHMNGDMMNEKRNVLIEAARIVRGNVLPLSEFKAKDYNALLLPGGYGAAKNLSSYAFQGAAMQVHEDVINAVTSMHEQRKPIGAMCIAPVIIARLIPNALLTVGRDNNTMSNLTTMGAVPKIADQTEVVTDEKNLLYSTPAYMLETDLAKLAEGAENLVKEMMKEM